MSHEATAWAFRQRGIKPAAKMVLMALADRHNADTRQCFPSQELLAEDACMSRSALNDNLARLEAAGLIRRVVRRHPTRRTQERTHYVLGFEAAFAQDDAEPCPETGHGFEADDDDAPCPETGLGAVSGFSPEPCPENARTRVRNPDSNLGNELGNLTSPAQAPAREAAGGEAGEGGDATPPDLDGEDWLDLLAALGVDPEQSGRWWSGERARNHVRGWLAGLGLGWSEILDVASAHRRRLPDPPQGPKALDKAMATAAAEKADAPRRAADRAAARARALENAARWIKDRSRLCTHLRAGEVEAARQAGLVTAAEIQRASRDWGANW